MIRGCGSWTNSLTARAPIRLKSLIIFFSADRLSEFDILVGNNDGDGAGYSLCASEAVSAFLVYQLFCLHFTINKE